MWAIRKTENQRMVLSNCGAGQDSWESLGLQGVKPVIPKGNESWVFSFSWNSNTLATWCKKMTHLKKPWCWERSKVGGEGDKRGWDGWMASPILWTWVWVGSGSWWQTGKPGVLQSMGSQRVVRNWATEPKLFWPVWGDYRFDFCFSRMCLFSIHNWLLNNEELGELSVHTYIM